MRLAFDPALALVLSGGMAIATAVLILLLMPMLERYALARPNARSSHAMPTPQGGGIAIVLAVGAVMIGAAISGLEAFQQSWVWSLLVALVALAVMGVIDDIRPQPVLPRLALQLAVASLLVQTLPADVSVLPLVPDWLESVALVVGLVWFINLTNFMDGIDWMTVSEMAPIAATLAMLGMLGLVPEMTALLPLVLALLGALIGFAPFNRHVSRLFLGDVGSLPIGALVGWLLIVLAAAGHVVAALILPLYYLSDATITLARRWRRGESLSQAHRSHFYQVATTRGYSVPAVTARVFGLNVLLGILAGASIVAARPVYGAMCLAAAVAATLVVLWCFEKGRTR